MKTDISVKSGSRVRVTFDSTGDYPISWNNVLLNVLNKEKGAFYVDVDGKRIPQFLSIDDWEESGEGWVYDLSSRFVRIKFGRPEKKSFDVIVSFEKFDLIGMFAEQKKNND